MSELGPASKFTFWPLWSDKLNENSKLQLWTLREALFIIPMTIMPTPHSQSVFVGPRALFEGVLLTSSITTSWSTPEECFSPGGQIPSAFWRRPQCLLVHRRHEGQHLEQQTESETLIILNKWEILTHLVMTVKPKKEGDARNRQGQWDGPAGPAYWIKLRYKVSISGM